ncbi:hypothetical protein N431DRAFT_555478 [Stipitochalara longipes BDJ]|nr:hypothetical protein N431DRAFT_555478 [Stipitochalara longipes BDJ]
MEIYAVIDGFRPAPGLFSSWGHVHPLVTGYKNAKFRKFASISEAELYMKKSDVKDYIRIIKPASVETTRLQGKKAYYAVANGQSPGVRECYFGDAGTEPEVVKFPGACYKRFSNLASAEEFIADWVEMNSFVCEDLTKDRLSREVSAIKHE